MQREYTCEDDRVPWMKGTVHIYSTPRGQSIKWVFYKRRSRKTHEYPLHKTTSKDSIVGGVAPLPIGKFKTHNRTVVSVRRRCYGMIALYMINPGKLQRAMRTSQNKMVTCPVSIPTPTREWYHHG